MSTNQLERLLRKWQKILRLQDWHINIGYCRVKDMLTGASVAEIVPDLALKRAEIHILDPLDSDEQDAVEVEATIVHELLHLHWHYFTRNIKADSPDYFLSEQALDCIADALVNRAPAMR